MEKGQNFILNKIFTIPYMDKIISGNNKEEFVRYVSRYVKKEDDLTYGDAISQIYHYMDLSYRNEYYYKNTIFNQMLVKKHQLYHTAALTELPIAGSKDDFVMINGRGVVYEIKTDLDDFARLRNQIHDYYKAFSYVNVVVGERKYDKVKELLKDTKVGIYVLYDSGNLVPRKCAKCNRKNLSYESIFQMLRRKEYESIILKYFKKLPQVNSFYYYRECQQQLRQLGITTLQREMQNCLKQRTLLVVENPFDEEIPRELQFYTYFSKENRGKYEMIHKFWNEKMEV